MVLFSINSIFSQDCETVIQLYKDQKYGKVNNLFYGKENRSILKSPCFNYYFSSLDKKNQTNTIYSIAISIAESNAFVLPDSTLNTISTCYEGMGYGEMGRLTRWFLNQDNLTKQALARVYDFYKTKKYELVVFTEYSSFQLIAAKKYILFYGINDEKACEMFDFLNYTYKQSLTGSFFHYETDSPEEYKKAVEQEYINPKSLSTFDLSSKLSFAIPHNTNWFTSEKNMLSNWTMNEKKLYQLDTTVLNNYFKFFNSNHFYYKAAIALSAKLLKCEKSKVNYMRFYAALAKIPYEMFPIVNKQFDELLNAYELANKQECVYHKDYLNLLATSRQYKRGMDYIQVQQTTFKQCQNWDSLQQSFKLLNIFDRKQFVENPPSVFINAINENIPFYKINVILKETLPRQNSEVASNIFFTLYKTYPQHRDSLWWGMCDHLFPGSSFAETEINQFLTIYKERKRTKMVETVQYDLWSGKTHTQILDAIKTNKLSKNPGWQLIAEYGIYYYSESESRNTTETKKKALNLMQQAAAYFKYDGELQKHIGHCLFLLGRSSEAQPYYKKAKQLGANMTDVGAYGGTGTRTGPRGGKYQFKISPGTVGSQEE
jgi:hypothetical protein